ncbi:MAG: HlyD family efflux transporter periplasmic adaptor subunit [Rhodopirellula sp.]|nr:HlyD family efflux transporter periplasmic adaptor subunit [Rhodopirellula sp.]
MKRILPIVVVASGLTALLVASQQREVPFVVSGTIEADDVRLGSRIGGRVAAVHVEEGQLVKAGQTLVELQPFDLKERLAQAKQTLIATEAQLRQSEAGFRSEEVEQSRALRDEAEAALEELRNGPRPQEIAASEAQLRLTQAELKNATLVYNRTEALFGKGAIDQSDLDDAGTKLSVAQATAEDRQEKLNLLKAGTRQEEVSRAEARMRQAEQALKLRESGYRSEEVDEVRARRDGAEAALRIVEKQLEELSVKAPFDGVVEAIDLRPGDMVPPNAPVVSLLDTRRLYVRAYVPENRLGLQVGQQIDLSVDSFPGERFTGEVTFVARQAEFTPGNVQTPEERSKQVFRFRVQLTSGLDRLRPGMAADVRLELSGSGS